MKAIHVSAALAAAVLLVACGGGDDKIQFTSVVSFGDSLSDAGTYNVGTIAALGGGKFTVNGAGATSYTWTEDLAVAVKAPPQCAARTGLLPNQPGVTGAPVTDIAGCYNYAQGSSRVTSEGSGPNGVALQAYGQMNLGFMANSLMEQMNRHLAKVGGAYSGFELVTVNSGGNDSFMQLNGVASAAGGGAAAVGAGTIAGWPQSVLNTVGAGGAAATNAAASAAVTAMGQAGLELAGYIKTLIVAKGARFVLVRNLGNINVTPYGVTLDAGTQGLITNMTRAFNSQLSAGLSGTAGVVILDDYTLSNDVVANPVKYGFTNVTATACANNAFGGSSIVCNSTNVVAGSTQYAFADSVHPTPYSHQKEAEAAYASLVAAGWQ
ncbi:MAG: SGNH/GDSL hydrolase family protein [Caldimonas sp.]